MKIHHDNNLMNLGAALHDLAQAQSFDAEQAWAAVQARLTPKPPNAAQAISTPTVHSLWRRLRRRLAFTPKPALAAK